MALEDIIVKKKLLMDSSLKENFTDLWYYGISNKVVIMLFSQKVILLYIENIIMEKLKNNIITIFNFEKTFIIIIGFNY